MTEMLILLSTPLPDFMKPKAKTPLCSGFYFLKQYNILQYITIYNNFFSHSDLHGGNLMRNDGEVFDPDSLILVDWDLAAYGYRAFDIMYHLHKWPTYPSNGNVFISISKC